MTSYSIGEVAEMLGVKAHVIRYWEQNVPLLSPRKSNSGRREFSPSDLQTLYRIRYLLHERRFTLEGASEQIMRELSGAAPDRTARIRALRHTLLELRTRLGRSGTPRPAPQESRVRDLSHLFTREETEPRRIPLVRMGSSPPELMHGSVLPVFLVSHTGSLACQLGLACRLASVVRRMLSPGTLDTGILSLPPNRPAPPSGYDVPVFASERPRPPVTVGKGSFSEGSPGIGDELDDPVLGALISARFDVGASPGINVLVVGPGRAPNETELRALLGAHLWARGEATLAARQVEGRGLQHRGALLLSGSFVIELLEGRRPLKYGSSTTENEKGGSLVTARQILGAARSPQIVRTEVV